MQMIGLSSYINRKCFNDNAYLKSNALRMELSNT